jgi:hypothetical protein
MLRQTNHELETPNGCIFGLEANGRIEASANDQPDEGGMESLRTAADVQVRLKANDIVSKVAEKAASGDLNSAKFLVMILKEKARAVPWRRKSGPSEAARLAAEPPWEEPPEPSSDDAGDADLES